MRFTLRLTLFFSADRIKPLSDSFDSLKSLILTEEMIRLKLFTRSLCVLCALCLLLGSALADEGCGIGDAAFVEFERSPENPAVRTAVSPAPAANQGNAPVNTAPSAANPLETEDTTRGFVYRMYKTVLGREPDPAGFDSWVKSLDDGTATAADLVYGFFNSGEYMGKGKSSAEIVTDCYRTMLNRDPDAAGLEAWEKALDVGMSSDVVCAGFVSSIEFNALAAKYGIKPGTLTLTKARDQNYERTAFVYRLYVDCLNRLPEVAGLESWCQALGQGTEGTTVAYGFIFSREYMDTLPDNDQFVDMLYRTILGRDGDKGGMSSWVNLLNYTSTREKILNGFMFSPEFAAKCKTAGINVGKKIYEPDESREWKANILMLSLVNGVREAYGLDPLITREDLWSRVAMVRANEIDTYFNHTRPNGQPFYTIYDEAGFDYYLVGENIGYGYGNEQAVFEAWMDSYKHRENILRDTFAILATGFYKGRTTNWAQNFMTLFDRE